MTYLLIDGNNLAYRCFFAQSELYTLSGRRSGAVHGFLNSLAAIRYKLNVPMEQTAIFWDGGRSEFRTKLYPEYKQGRKFDNPQTEQDIERKMSMHDQLLNLKQGLKLRPIRQVEVNGTEADDLVSLIANLCTGDVVAHSGDYDFRQLLDPGSNRIRVFDPKHGFVAASQVADDLGLNTFDRRRFVLARAITGDASDAIKGVGQIGEKRIKRIMPYLSLDGLIVCQSMECSDPRTQKMIDRVLEADDIIARNIQLMELPTDWATPLYPPEKMEECLVQFQTLGEDNLPAFASFLREWELEEALENLGSYQ